MAAGGPSQLHIRFGQVADDGGRLAGDVETLRHGLLHRQYGQLAGILFDAPRQRCIVRGAADLRPRWYRSRRDGCEPMLLCS